MKRRQLGPPPASVSTVPAILTRNGSGKASRVFVKPAHDSGIHSV